MSKKKKAETLTVAPTEAVVAYSDEKLLMFGSILNDRFEKNRDAIDLEKQMAEEQVDDEDDVRERLDSLEVQSGQGVVATSDVMRQLQQTRDMILRAQARLRDKTYGVCGCRGTPHLIDEARLKAAPTTTSCGLAKGLVPASRRQHQAAAA